MPSGIPWTPCSASRPQSVPLAGYVRVESVEAQFRGSLVDNPGEGTAAVPALLASATSRLVFPYFVIGGGYNTVITLINASDKTAVVTATAFDTDGTEIAPGFTIRILPQAMDDLDWAAILGTGGGLRQGYFKLSIEPVSQPNPFIGGPHLAGSVHIEAPASRVAAPLLNARGDEFFFTPVRVDADVYTGLSILNDGPEEIEVLIEAYDANGRLLDATEEELVIAGGASRIGAATGTAAQAGRGRWGLRPRIVDVDPDAAHRLSRAAGRHPAAASGRADGALAFPGFWCR